MSTERPGRPGPDAPETRATGLAGLGPWLLDARAAAWLAAGLFLALVLLLGAQGRFLHDEGLFTFQHCRTLWDEWWAIFFLHKGKPVNVLLGALPALGGYRAFLVGHALLSACALPLVAGTARALGLRHPNLAAWFLATSGIFAVSAANGYPNAIGATALALFLYLYYTKRRVPAALVLGLLPFSRYELGFVLLAYAGVRVLKERDPGFVAWISVLPLLYVGAGALYTGDLLWLFHTSYDPNTMPNAYLGWDHGYDLAATWRLLEKEFLANSPLLLVFAPMAFFRRRGAAVEASAVGFAFLGTQTLIQVTELQGFTPNLRHSLGFLPLLALAVTAGMPEAFRLLARGSAALTGAPTGSAPGTLDGEPRAIPGTTRRYLRFIAVAVFILLFQVSAGLPEEREQHERSHALLEELAAQGLYTGQTIYTDIQAAEFDDCAGFRETRFLVNPQVTWELRALTKPSPAQNEAVFAAFREVGWIFAPERLPLEPGALYVLERLERSKAWMERLEEAGALVRDVGDFAVYNFPSKEPREAPREEVPRAVDEREPPGARQRLLERP